MVFYFHSEADWHLVTRYPPATLVDSPPPPSFRQFQVRLKTLLMPGKKRAVGLLLFGDTLPSSFSFHADVVVDILWIGVQQNSINRPSLLGYSDFCPAKNFMRCPSSPSYVLSLLSFPVSIFLRIGAFLPRWKALPSWFSVGRERHAPGGEFDYWFFSLPSLCHSFFFPPPFGV